MAKRVLVVFTFRSVDRLLAEGGSQSWALNQANARRCSYVVCTRNRHHEDASQQEEHGAAFLVGKISSVEPSPEDPARFIVRFDSYALIKTQPIVWPGARNPVWYVDDFADINIDEADLEWLPLSDAPLSENASEKTLQSTSAMRPAQLTIAQAKAGLAATFGVKPECVEITIRG